VSFQMLKLHHRPLFANQASLVRGKELSRSCAAARKPPSVVPSPP
jgi:hypothetical protein